MLACEFSYSRKYIDKYINMPSLRALMKYRKQYPPASMLLKGILISLGAIEPEQENSSSSNQVIDFTKMTEEEARQQGAKMAQSLGGTIVKGKLSNGN